MATGHIYFICNRVNGRLYVGSTVTLKNRMRFHRSNLAYGRHKNRAMQDDYNLYGAANFAWGILDTVRVYRDVPYWGSGTVHELRIAEQFYIHSLGAAAPEGYCLNQWPAGQSHGDASHWLEWRRSGASPVDLFPFPRAS